MISGLAYRRVAAPETTETKAKRALNWKKRDMLISAGKSGGEEKEG
jgi:hypothetical protein